MKIIADQVEKRSVAILVLNKESAIWKDSSMKALLKHVQLKYTDVETMSVVTSNRWVAEQIKSDKVENDTTGGIKIENFGKSGNNESSKNAVMDGVQIEEFGRTNLRIPKPTRTRKIVR